MSDTLVLDIGYQPINVVRWRRAFNLYLKDGAEVLTEDTNAPIRCGSFEMGMPRVIRLKHSIGKFVRMHVPKSRRNILVRDDYRCQYCGVMLIGKDGRLHEFTLDHVLPKSRGGKSDWLNLVASCMKCNNTKDNQTPEEAGMRLLKKPAIPSPNDPRYFRGIKGMRNEWKQYLRQDKDTSWAYWNVELDN